MAISKNEYLSWKGSAVTTRLLELIAVGQDIAIEEVLTHRGEVSDYQRGAIAAFKEISSHIKDGDDLHDDKA